MTRVGIAGLWHETNTYSSQPTDLPRFAAFELLDGEAILGAHLGTGSVISGMLDSEDFDYVPIATAGAWPSGRVTKAALEDLHGRLQVGLEAAPSLDGLLLDLHGSMVAEGEDDVELATIRLIRDYVGDIPVAVVHDLHGSPSPDFVSQCDVLVGYDTYPHVDMRERGEEAGRMLASVLGGVRLRSLVRKVPLLVSPLAQGTDGDRMRRLNARARELEGESGIRRISIIPGFPYSDVERAGFSVVTVHEEGYRELAHNLSGVLADMIEDEDWTVDRPDAASAVAEAIGSDVHPVILADVADNIGGGSPGDGTALLYELLAQGAEGAVVSLADEEAANKAHHLGKRATFEGMVGGKTDPFHGDPVPVRGEVVELSDGSYRTQGTWQTGRSFSMGLTAVIDVDDVTLQVMERPTPPFHGEQLTSVGIDPAAASIITAKGALAWRAAYGDVARRVIEVDTPGICPVDPYVLTRSTMPMRV